MVQQEVRSNHRVGVASRIDAGQTSSSEDLPHWLWHTTVVPLKPRLTVLSLSVRQKHDIVHQSAHLQTISI